MSSKIYEKRAVLFLDILGFKVLVDQRQEHKIHKILSTSVAFSNGKPSFPDTNHTTAFSDSIVVSHRLDAAGIQNTINTAAMLAWAFLQQGILTRGGIACGEVHHTSDRLFGPAMNEAYLLESELAIFPRIIVSDEVKALVMHEKNDPAYQVACDPEVLKQDNDGAWYVDLMTHLVLSPYNLKRDRQAVFDSKVEAVRNALKTPSPPPGNNLRAQRKQDWLSTYLEESIRNGPSKNPAPVCGCY